VSKPSAADSVPLALLELQIGQRVNSVEETPIEHFWRAGDSVKVTLTPFDTARSRTLFAAGGMWGMLRLAQTKPSGIDVRFFDPDTKIELPLPAFPATAPELGGSPRAPVQQAAQPVSATAPPVVPQNTGTKSRTRTIP
jgi:hypothetical protein